MTDRKNILQGLEDAEDRIFLSHMLDLKEKSEKTQRIMYSSFLTPGQKILAEGRLSSLCDMRFSGGFKDAERVMAAFVPNEWDEEDYPFCGLEIKNLGKRELTHRDYLGSILRLGISRSLVGDIAVSEDGATVVISRDIADFILMNLSKVGSSGVRLGLLEKERVGDIVRNFKVSSVTVSSMRFDCVLSAATGKSRSAVSSLISEGIAEVNYTAEKNTSRLIKSGDVISLRGFGKFIAETDLATTKKGRIHVNIRKYI